MLKTVYWNAFPNAGEIPLLERCPCALGSKPYARNETVAELFAALGIDSISRLIGYREMPLDKLPQLIANRIPVIMVAGDPSARTALCCRRPTKRPDWSALFTSSPGVTTISTDWTTPNR